MEEEHNEEWVELPYWRKGCGIEEFEYEKTLTMYNDLYVKSFSKQLWLWFVKKKNLICPQFITEKRKHHVHVKLLGFVLSSKLRAQDHNYLMKVFIIGFFNILILLVKFR